MCHAHFHYKSVSGMLLARPQPGAWLPSGNRGSLWRGSSRPKKDWSHMVFRLIVSEAPDLTSIRVIGRLGSDAVTTLEGHCDRRRRPLVLDLSELTSASDAGVLLLTRLASEGVHLLGMSPYVRLLLSHSREASDTPSRGRRSPRTRVRRQAVGRDRAKRGS